MHTQVDYYNMLLVREFRNDNEAESKLDPNIVERKHQKLRRRKGLGGGDRGMFEGGGGGGKFLWN